MTYLAFVTVTPGKPYLKKGNDAVGSATGILGLTGIANGTIAVTGHNHAIRHDSNGPKIAIPFCADCGDFTIEVCFER